MGLFPSSEIHCEKMLIVAVNSCRELGGDLQDDVVELLLQSLITVLWPGQRRGASLLIRVRVRVRACPTADHMRADMR